MAVSALAFPEPWEQASESLKSYEYCVLNETDSKTHETVYTVLQKSFSSIQKHSFKTESECENYIREKLDSYCKKEQ